ncbi:hypothetical protein EEJ34_16425 [Vibrio cholerae]|nr:hypothetical protein EEJ34_16425 [Vibrio cholerae]
MSSAHKREKTADNVEAVRCYKNQKWDSGVPFISTMVAGYPLLLEAAAVLAVTPSCLGISRPFMDCSILKAAQSY